MVIWLIRAFSLLAVCGLAAAIWLAGPLVGFGDARPLATAAARLAVIAAALIAIAAAYGVVFWWARRAQRALAAAIAAASADESDADILETRMNDAIGTLRRVSGRRNFLYELPWYLIIGPPGAGKTTALVNSGLHFPITAQGEALPVAGLGGTRYCDWWFSDEAILIDTAGRYTMQDSDADADRRSWLAFLSILKRHRPRQPINGVILAISLSDLMTMNGQELGAHVIEVRKRLAEISASLRIGFPVYALFTKADLISGFTEYFGGFEEARRHKVWGATFQTSQIGRNMVADIPGLFDGLCARLAQELPDRLEEEPDPAARASIFGFPARFALLRQRVADFLGGVFDAADDVAPAANLRGFYFSSGTQEGTPIDQILGAMGRSFGASGGGHLSGKGKSFFLHDLLTRVIFAEAGWVSHDPAGDRRVLIGRYGTIAAASAAACLALVALGISFFANRALIVATEDAAAQFRAASEAVLERPVVTEPDLENVVASLEVLRTLPARRSDASAPPTLIETFGLGQWKRLRSASDEAYRRALERMLRPRALLQVEAAIHRSPGDPISLYEPLKVYLMLGGAAPKTEEELVVRWMRRDWERHRFPGSSNRAGRAVLEQHLRAMLEYDDAHDQLHELDHTLVEAARRALGRMTIADRSQAIFRSAIEDAAVTDFTLVARAGPEAPLVFAARDAAELSQLSVPGIYTRDGFNRIYLDQLARVAHALDQEKWVLGAGGEQGVTAEDLLLIGPELLDRYGEEFTTSWEAFLANLRFKPMSTDKPEYLALSAAASANSPVRRLFEAVAFETALTQGAETDGAQGTGGGGTELSAKEKAAGLALIGIELDGGKSQARAGAAFAGATGEIPGASIEARFRPYRILVEGRPGQRPIDALVQSFHDIYQAIVLAASAPANVERANAGLQLKIQTLRLNVSRLPPSLAIMVQEVADEIEGEAVETSIERLNETLGASVAGPCREIIDNRYPFVTGGSVEVSLSDFARLFAPGGIIDRYFAQNLAQLVDISGPEWRWRNEGRLNRTMSRSTLTQFQLAAQIRDAFFKPGDPVPSVKLVFTPVSLHGDANLALLSVNGQVVQSYQTGNSATTLEWPGAGGQAVASISLTPDLPGRESTVRFQGDWALKRMLDGAATNSSNDTLEARFVIGGRDVTYAIQSATGANPFSLPALSQFSCPAEL